MLFKEKEGNCTVEVIEIKNGFVKCLIKDCSLKYESVEMIEEKDFEEEMKGFIKINN